MRRNHGSKWVPGSIRHCGGGQADQGEVLDDCCHVTSTLGAFGSDSEGYIIIIASFFRHKLR